MTESGPSSPSSSNEGFFSSVSSLRERKTRRLSESALIAERERAFRSKFLNDGPTHHQ